MKKRTIILKVEPEFFTDIKVQVAKKGMTLHSYILGLIKKDIEENAISE